MDPHNTISRKRQRVTNQITGGISSDGAMITDSVRPIEGRMILQCPSRDKRVQHIIKMFIDSDGSMNFMCDCTGGTDVAPSGHCIHLNNAMIHICKQFIHSSVKFMTEKEQHIVLKKKLTDLDDLMSDVHIF
jgi:hypothetical protein